MSTLTADLNLDPLLPQAMAEKAEALGVKKPNLDLMGHAPHHARTLD